MRETMFKYLVVGTVGYLINIGLLASLTRGLGANPYLAVGVAYIANTVWNYVLIRTWVFRSTHNAVAGEVVRFLVVAGVLLVWNFCTFHVLYAVAGLPGEIANTMSIILGLPLGYALNRSWAFARRREVP